MHAQPRSLAAPLCPRLVGRDDLLALADRRIGAVRAGAGHLLFLAGEAGIGKTRLLVEIGNRATAAGFTTVIVGAYPRDAEVAGGVLADLAAALRRTPSAGPTGAQIAQRLRESGGGDGDASRQRRLLVADLAEILLTLGSEPASLGAAQPADGHPVLLALEDLHWADDLTLEVVNRVARRLPSAPMLVVGTYRSDELYPRVPMRAWRSQLLTQRLAEEVRLGRLAPAGTAEMIATITGSVASTVLTTAVHERSDGIPLHVEEFLEACLADQAVVSDPRIGTHRRVPDTLADAVLVRAEALNPSARTAAAAASVIGRSFDVDLLTAVTGEEPDEVDAALRELEERFFVQPSGDGLAYDFRHALIRDALYADLPPHRRRDLHGLVAAFAAEFGFPDAFVSDQYERAHQPGPAYRHALAAAAEARALSAHREAVELYRRAQRTAPSDTQESERAELLAALGGELAAIDDNAGAAAAYGEAYSLWRQCGDDGAAASLAPALAAVRHLLGATLDERTGLLRDALSLIEPARGESTQDTRTRILAGLSAAYMLDRRLEESIEHGRWARSLAAGRGDRAARLNAEVTLGSALVFAGKMEEGWRLLETAIDGARDANLEVEAARAFRMMGSCASVLVEYDHGLRWLQDGIAYAERTERFNDRHYMTAHLAHVLWATGDWSAATIQARHALADGPGGITTRITALHVLGYLALGAKDWSAANTHLHEARELGARMGELQRLSPALWGLAELSLHSGDAEAAVAFCEQGFSASAAVDDAAYLFPFLVTGTRAHLVLDEFAAARTWVERCGELLRRRGIPGTLAALDHADGLLLLADGHTGRARDALARAGEGWNQRHRFWEGTQALIDRAHAAARSRRPAEAASLMTEANDRARTAGASLLESLAAASPTPSGRDRSQPLTARELEIARLVATGATNRQIAAQLSISPKTVAAHVEHILTKLNAARRAEIAAWAIARTRGLG